MELSRVGAIFIFVELLVLVLGLLATFGAGFAAEPEDLFDFVPGILEFRHPEHLGSLVGPSF